MKNNEINGPDKLIEASFVSISYGVVDGQVSVFEAFMKNWILNE